MLPRNWIAPTTSRALTKSEMKNNALLVGMYFKKQKWTPYAIAGMLGNMEAESTINPSRWENDDANKKEGYGLVQWTPYTNYSTWAGSGWEGNGNKECERIEYELKNNLQWIATSAYNFSFSAYSKMKNPPEYMADAFLKNYERPQDTNQPIRGTYARNWFKIILKYLYPEIWLYFQYNKYYRKVNMRK